MSEFNSSVHIPEAEPTRSGYTAGDSRKRSWARRIVSSSLVLGLLGGAIGSYGIIRFFPGTIPVDRQELIVQESSAVVDVAKKVSPSVVSITTQTIQLGRTFFGFQQDSRTSESAGTGVIIDTNGLILTNNHVIADSSTITVFTSDGKQHKATVVATNASQDYAFIRMDDKSYKPAAIGNSADVRIGQRVIAIGNALGQFSNTVTDGIISGKGRPIVAGNETGSSQESLQDLLQTDAAINPGNSGGPLVNLQGQVIGINTAVAGSAQNIGFAIPINEIKPAIASVKEKGVIERPYLGVRYVSVTPAVASANNLSVSSGAFVTSDGQNPAIVPGSPAEAAGLKDGDVITKVNNESIGTEHSLTSLLGSKKPGDKVTLTILREGKTQTLTATIGTAPATT